MGFDVEHYKGVLGEFLETNGYFLIEFHVSNLHHMIQTVVHKKGGITHKDCGEVSKLIQDRMLEDSIDVNAEFSIEVSSPGINRKLKNLEEIPFFLNENIEVKFTSSENDITESGENLGFKDETLIIRKSDGTEQEINKSDIKKIKLVD
ncbi:MAG: hypothetical protein KAR07_12400 [Spirochaetes bacterium]|nr:hypothetical protein [Spirochaetota bacterium]